MPKLPDNHSFQNSKPQDSGDDTFANQCDQRNSQFLGSHKVRSIKTNIFNCLKVVGAAIGAALLALFEVSFKVMQLAVSSFKKRAIPKFDDALLSLAEMAKRFKTIKTDWIVDKLKLTHEQEQVVLNQLKEEFEISVQQWEEILRGAHVLLDDGGRCYQQWANQLPDKFMRSSSHASQEPQYALRGELVKEMLFGCIQNSSGEKYSWFQLEKTPLSFGQISIHLIDYCRYVITGCNQGPFGSSSYTDNHPLVLKLKSKDRLEEKPSTEE